MSFDEQHQQQEHAHSVPLSPSQPAESQFDEIVELDISGKQRIFVVIILLLPFSEIVMFVIISENKHNKNIN